MLDIAPGGGLTRPVSIQLRFLSKSQKLHSRGRTGRGPSPVVRFLRALRDLYGSQGTGNAPRHNRASLDLLESPCLLEPAAVVLRENHVLPTRVHAEVRTLVAQRVGTTAPACNAGSAGSSAPNRQRRERRASSGWPPGSSCVTSGSVRNSSTASAGFQRPHRVSCTSMYDPGVTNFPYAFPCTGRRRGSKQRSGRVLQWPHGTAMGPGQGREINTATSSARTGPGSTAAAASFSQRIAALCPP